MTTDEPRNPKVTVIIPTYNRANQMVRSISSVLGQTYGDFELIIVDDASSDNTAEIMASFDDERVKCIRREQNGGAAAARNTGIRAATGEFVAFNDSDDEWLPDKLERQMEVFEIVPSKVGVVYCDSWLVHNGKEGLLRAPNIMPEDGMVFRRALAGHVYGIGVQTAIFRKECFEIAGLFDENLRVEEDSEFFIRVCKHYCLYHISVPLVKRFVTQSSLWFGNDENHLRAHETILKKYWEDIRVDRRLKSQRLMGLCWWATISGRRRKACKYFARALIASPPESLVFVLSRLVGGRSQHVPVKLAVGAVARLPKSLYRMVARVKPRPSHPSSNAKAHE